MIIEGLDELNTSITVTENLDVEETQIEDLDTNINPDGDGTSTDGEGEGEGAGTNTDGEGDGSEGITNILTGDDTPPAEGGDGEGKDGDDTGIKNLSGIEQYLSTFNIEGGMVDFKDGTKIHFDELEADKQLEVLSKLHESSTQDIEAKFGLNDDEIGLINYMRKEEGTIDEIINNMAQQRAQTYITSQEVQTQAIDKMDDDAIYTSFLIKGSPDATTEDIEKDLAKAKEMSGYTNNVANLRERMVSDQEASLAQEQVNDREKMNSEIEEQRKQVVKVVSGMESVDGLSINDGIKNDVLDLILTVDDEGDSQFMTEVFSDPEKLFKAAFWYKNGTDIISNREDFWKKEKSAAYKRGLKDAQAGKRTFTSADVTGKYTKPTPHQESPDDYVMMDDLYTD